MFSTEPLVFLIALDSHYYFRSFFYRFAGADLFIIGVCIVLITCYHFHYLFFIYFIYYYIINCITIFNFSFTFILSSLHYYYFNLLSNSHPYYNFHNYLLYHIILYHTRLYFVYLLSLLFFIICSCISLQQYTIQFCSYINTLKQTHIQQTFVKYPSRERWKSYSFLRVLANLH